VRTVALYGYIGCSRREPGSFFPARVCVRACASARVRERATHGSAADRQPHPRRTKPDRPRGVATETRHNRPDPSPTPACGQGTGRPARPPRKRLVLPDLHLLQLTLMRVKLGERAQESLLVFVVAPERP
jgi:hypothetical protein